MSHFQPDISSELCLLRVPAVFDPVGQEIKDELDSLLKLKCFVFVADFVDVRKMTRNMISTFVKFSNSLKDSDRFFHSVNLDRESRIALTADGLDEIYGISKSLAEIKKRHNISLVKPFHVDVNFINPFIVATYEALKVQANIDAKAQRPALKSKTQMTRAGIAGVIALKSPGFKGNITLCFPTEVFLKIYEILVAEKHEVIGKEIEDFAAELLNIIYGQAKMKLNQEQGYQLQQAIPKVLTGEKLASLPPSSGATMVLPFDTPVGQFYIEIETA